MKILFLDQSGQIGGAELCLVDIAKPFRDNCLICLFADGPFRKLLEQQKIPVRVLANRSIRVRKQSNLMQGIGSIGVFTPIVAKVAEIAWEYDLIYANTQKALVIGAIASLVARRPLVYHLHDILSAEHFSAANRRLAVTLANRFASLVIANSKATQAAFIEAGGQFDLTEVVYNGFDPAIYQIQTNSLKTKQNIGLEGQFVVGHFSRLSPWKGQHILLEALTRCPDKVTAIFVGDALFGEKRYVEQLHQKVVELGLSKRVQFFGFRGEVAPLMAVCDLIAHTSTAPEPFGRVIVEAMLCGRPVVASAAGGAIELIETGKTGWLVEPGNVEELADAIAICYQHPMLAQIIAQHAQKQARERFHISVMEQKIARLLNLVIDFH
ncbi:MAG: glycosyltransferase family 4 protein [Hydrococcus sp. Prado102]|jgi:glycosyltransferase involved in cell wall biosynthesis|nr:glycosyltransferase family 4 protein [Hydrococcus sp. Prado102]